MNRRLAARLAFALVIVVAAVAPQAIGQDSHRREVTLESGRSLTVTFQQGTVTSSNDKAIGVRIGDRDRRFPRGRRLYCLHSDSLVVDPDVSVEVAEGDTVEVGSAGGAAFIVKIEQPVEPVDGAPEIPALDDVRDVLQIDGLETEFALLPKRDQNTLLRIAADMKLDADARKSLRIDPSCLHEHAHYFNQRPLRQWLLDRAGDRGAMFVENVGVRDELRESVLLEFAVLPLAGSKTGVDVNYVSNVGKRIKDGGLSELVDAEKEFVQQNRSLFGIDERYSVIVHWMLDHELQYGDDGPDGGMPFVVWKLIYVVSDEEFVSTMSTIKNPEFVSQVTKLRKERSKSYHFN